MIQYSFVYTEEAYQDLRQIVNWYKHQKVGLDTEFLLSVEAAVKQIQRNPLGYPPALRNTRQILLRRFPYKIIFKIYDESTINIYGVFHNSRNPDLIRKRLK
jgi:toxin ParE1/3/4